MLKRTFIAILFLTTAIVVKSQTFTDGVSYNDYIVNLQSNVATNLMDFNNALIAEFSTMESVKPYYDALIVASDEALLKTKALPAFNGDSTLRDAAADLFAFYNATFKNEYVTVMGIVFDPNMTMDMYTQMTNILNDVSLRESAYDLSFQTSQYLFAIKNGFTLQENELQESIDE